MGIFKDPLPTATDPVEDSGSDPEKVPIPVQQEDGSSPPEGIHQHVNPEIEKRVVRKLDMRFTLLVGFLCTILTHPFGSGS